MKITRRLYCNQDPKHIFHEEQHGHESFQEVEKGFVGLLNDDGNYELQSYNNHKHQGYYIFVIPTSALTQLSFPPLCSLQNNSPQWIINSSTILVPAHQSLYNNCSAKDVNSFVSKYSTDEHHLPRETKGIPYATLILSYPSFSMKNSESDL